VLSIAPVIQILTGDKREFVTWRSIHHFLCGVSSSLHAVDIKHFGKYFSRGIERNDRSSQPEKAAEELLKGIGRDKFLILAGIMPRILCFVNRNLPGLSRTLMDITVNRAMKKPFYYSSYSSCPSSHIYWYWYLVFERKVSMRPSRYIVWSTDDVDLKDPFQKKWFMKQVLTHGRSEDIAALDWDEVRTLIPELDLPVEIAALWEDYFNAVK
jgi:hypothetical protein